MKRNMKRNMSRNASRRGTVLLAVLWSISLVSALAMAAAVTFRGYAGVMAVERDRVQADALLTAGLELAAGTIESLGDAPLAELETMLALGTGAVRVRLDDEGGRIDIGAAPLELLAALLRSVGAPPGAAKDVAQRIVDRRDGGRAARPDATRRSANVVPRRAGTGQPFSDIRQLQSIPGMAPDWIVAMTPLITIYGSETVNPLTAPPGVIAALPGFDGARLDAFLRTRRSFPADADRLMQIAGAAQAVLAVKPQRVATVELSARLSSGYAAAARAVIAVLPQDSEPYRVLAWMPLPDEIARR
jgi:general secretion pathway protein K